MKPAVEQEVVGAAPEEEEAKMLKEWRLMQAAGQCLVDIHRIQGSSSCAPGRQ